LEKYPEIKTEYLEWVNPENMEILSSTSQQKNPAICIAAWVEGIRLIDNLLSEN
jgi:pantothenate synthetase